MERPYERNKMYYNSNFQANLASWKVFFVMLSMFVIWQYTITQSHAESSSTKPESHVILPAPIITEQNKQETLALNYQKAKFLSVVDTGDTITHNKTELFCMAKNIYHEAGNQSTLGKFAVAQVTINRTKDPKFAGDVCDVVFAPYQFSWANNHRLRWSHPSESAQWDKSMEVAKEALDGKRIKGMEDALYYHANYVRPGWRHVVRLAQIGAHIFYERA